MKLIDMPDHGEPFFAMLPPGRFDVDLFREAGRELVREHANEIDRPGEGYGHLMDETLDFGGTYRHQAIDAHHVREAMPFLDPWVAEAMPWVSDIVGRPCIPSPYPRSAATLKYYGPGACQGWHYDTNPVTLLLWLTDCPAGGELEVCPRGLPAQREAGVSIEDVLGTEEVWRVQPKAGQVLLMAGRQFVHRVREQPEGADRMMIPVNVYHPDDIWRPSAVDAVVYGDGAGPG